MRITNSSRLFRPIGLHGTLQRYAPQGPSTNRYVFTLVGEPMNKIAFFLLLLPSISWGADSSTFEALLKAKVCSDSSNQIDCKYDLGKSFSLGIAGIGQNDASIIFYKSDFDGEFYGKVGVLHGCVIVAKSKLISDMAFVSPKNGKVYKAWTECAETK